MKRNPEILPELLAELIAIPSPYFREHRVAAYVHEVMLHNGISPLRQKVSEPELQAYEGENIVGVVDRGKETTLLINAHMDTVYPTRDWQGDPHQACIEGDDMVGLGAADMKGGLAAMLMAQKEIMRRIGQGETPAYNVVFLASVDEEGPDSLGARCFLQEARAREIDYCLVLESGQGLSRGEAAFPTLIHGSLGCYLYRITITGRSAHAADPDAGANAIDAMSHVLAALKEVPLETVPGFSQAVCNTLWIHGGEKALSTPECCEILVDFHVTPAEDSRKLKAKIIQQLQSLDMPVTIAVDHWRNGKNEPVIYPPYDWGLGHPLTQKLAETCRRVTGKAAGRSATSICVGDFNHFSHAGIPTMILGPDGANLHAGGERVNVKNLQTLVDILVDFLMTPV